MRYLRRRQIATVVLYGLAVYTYCCLMLRHSRMYCVSGTLLQEERLIRTCCGLRHVLMQKVVTLNTCCDVACLAFQLPHITTGSFQSHRLFIYVATAAVAVLLSLPSSDHTGKDPSEDRNGNCRRAGGIPTRKGDKRSNHESQNTDAQEVYK